MVAYGVRMYELCINLTAEDILNGETRDEVEQVGEGS